MLQKIFKIHLVFATSLSCCVQMDDDPYHFMTDLYPIYLIILKFKKIYDLDFLEISLKK